MIEQVEQVGDVAEALRHLLTLGIDHEPVVHPVVGEPLPERHRLRTLVLVMGELEVHPSAVEVEPLAEQPEAHDHALAVPTRATLPPGRWPRRLTGLGELPQREVSRMPLGIGTEHFPLTATGEQIVEVLVGEQAVIGHRFDAEIHPVVGDVGAVTGDQLADHRHHLVDPFGGMRHIGRPGHAEIAHRLEPHRFALLSDLLPRPVLTVGTVDDLVVDIGDVAGEAHVQAAPFEIAAQHVVHQGGPAMAEMRGPVHRGATQVDAHRAGLAQGELTNLSGGSVVQVQHGLQPTSARR